MEQEHKRLSLNRYVIGSLAVLVILGGVTGFTLIKHNQANAASTSTRPVAKSAVQTQSQFSFGGVADWRQGPSNNTSIALFYNPNDCFTSVEYQAGTIDPNAALQQKQASLTADGYISTPGSVVTATMPTSDGAVQYQMHQYAVTGGGASKLYSGQEFGYAQLAKGYLKIEGYCEPAQHLPATIPALQAVTFKAE
jgi:hypothetical protein